MPWFRIRADLRDASTPVWRELLVPSDLPLPELHTLLQAAMGWQNSHLHAFARGGEDHWTSRQRRVVDVGDGEFDHESGRPEAEASLATLVTNVGDEATYLYDFGDDWEHLLTLIEVLDGDASAVADLASPALTDGAGVCPPEDCGGVGGHAELLEAVDSLERGEQLEEWPEHVVRWAFGTLDVERIRAALTFDLARHQAAVDAIGRPLPSLHPVLAAMVAALPGLGPDSLRGMVQAAGLHEPADLTADDAAVLTENLRWFLDLVGDDGLTLTSAGYLRPAVVQAVAERLRLRREWIGTLNREDQTPGVADFRALVIALGLVRKVKGRLVRTKVGTALRNDPGRLLSHVTERMPLGREDFERQAGALVMLDLLAGAESRSATSQRAAAILTDLGWRSDGGQVNEWAVYHGTPSTAYLQRCGVLAEGPRGPGWEATDVGIRFLRTALRGEGADV